MNENLTRKTEKNKLKQKLINNVGSKETIKDERSSFSPLISLLITN